MLAYCLDKPGAWPDNPWGHEHPVVKVGPGEARQDLRLPRRRRSGGQGRGHAATSPTSGSQRYPDDASVMAYIGRSGWNDLAFGGAIPDDELMDAVDESYRLVVSKIAEEAPPRGLGRASGTSPPQSCCSDSSDGACWTTTRGRDSPTRRATTSAT